MDIGNHFNKKAIAKMSDAEFIDQYKGKLSIPLEDVWMYCTNTKLKRDGRDNKKSAKSSKTGRSKTDSSSTESTED